MTRITHLFASDSEFSMLLFNFVIHKNPPTTSLPLALTSSLPNEESIITHFDDNSSHPF